MMLAKGQKVTVYHDPTIGQNPEGEAVLIRQEMVIGDGLELWEVRFETGEICLRSIKGG